MVRLCVLARLSFISLCVFVPCAVADPGTLYAVDIRAVGARELVTAAEQSAPAMFDAALSDIQPQLSALNYRSYRLLSKVQRTVAENSSDWVRLAGGQVVRFRPVRSDGSRIGLWLKWDDAQGSEILNTQLHLLPGHQMLTGVEGIGDKGVILAIAVSPVAR